MDQSLDSSKQKWNTIVAAGKFRHDVQEVARKDLVERFQQRRADVHENLEKQRDMLVNLQAKFREAEEALQLNQIEIEDEQKKVQAVEKTVASEDAILKHQQSQARLKEKYSYFDAVAVVKALSHFRKEMLAILASIAEVIETLNTCIS